MRRSSRSVTFNFPFLLPELPNVTPAGTYIVDVEEEEISANAPILVRTVLRLIGGNMTQFVVVDPRNIERALDQDREKIRLLRFANQSSAQSPDSLPADDGTGSLDTPGRPLIGKSSRR